MAQFCAVRQKDGTAAILYAPTKRCTKLSWSCAFKETCASPGYRNDEAWFYGHLPTLCFETGQSDGLWRPTTESLFCLARHLRWNSAGGIGAISANYYGIAVRALKTANKKTSRPPWEKITEVDFKGGPLHQFHKNNLQPHVAFRKAVYDIGKRKSANQCTSKVHVGPDTELHPLSDAVSQGDGGVCRTCFHKLFQKREGAWFTAAMVAASSTPIITEFLTSKTLQDAPIREMLRGMIYVQLTAPGKPWPSLHDFAKLGYHLNASPVLLSFPHTPEEATGVPDPLRFLELFGVERWCLGRAAIPRNRISTAADAWFRRISVAALFSYGRIQLTGAAPLALRGPYARSSTGELVVVKVWQKKAHVRELQTVHFRTVFHRLAQSLTSLIVVPSHKGYSFRSDDTTEVIRASFRSLRRAGQGHNTREVAVLDAENLHWHSLAALTKQFSIIRLYGNITEAFNTDCKSIFDRPMCFAELVVNTVRAHKYGRIAGRWVSALRLAELSHPVHVGLGDPEVAARERVLLESLRDTGPTWWTEWKFPLVPDTTEPIPKQRQGHHSSAVASLRDPVGASAKRRRVSGSARST